MSVDRAWRVSVGFTVHREVAVSGYADPLSGADGVVIDRFAIGVGRQQLWENAATCRPVPFLGSYVFRS